MGIIDFGVGDVLADPNVMTKGDMMQFAFLRNTYALNLTVQKCCLMHSTLTFSLRGTSAV